MEITINLKEAFTDKYNELQKKYGNTIAKLNGFSEGQLSYTDFIDNFIDNDVVADASIDANSNV